MRRRRSPRVPFLRHVVPEPVRRRGSADATTRSSLADTLRGRASAARLPGGGLHRQVRRSDPAAAGRLRRGSGKGQLRDSRSGCHPRARRRRSARAADGQSDSLSGREPYIHVLHDAPRFPGRLRRAAARSRSTSGDMPVLRLRQSWRPRRGIDAGRRSMPLDELPLPTAREIRLTVRAVADADPVYFAKGAHIGKPVQVRLRRESSRRTVRSVASRRGFAGSTCSRIRAPIWDGTFNTLLFAAHAPAARPAIIDAAGAARSTSTTRR